MTEAKETENNNIEEAENLVKKSAYASMAAGLVPVPVFDFVAITAIQIEMIRRLGNIYKIPFMEGKVKNLVGALIGGSFPSSLAPLFFSLSKMVPVVGWTLGAVSVPLAAGASTYAVGKVFTQHFESGGTFLTFDPKAVREHYRAYYKEHIDQLNENEKPV